MQTAFCRLVTAVIVLLVWGCSSRVEPLPTPVMQQTEARAASTPIKHIVIVVQEKRTFNDLFAGWPGAATSNTGQLHTGERIRLRETTYAQDRAMMDAFGWAKIIAFNGGRLNAYDMNEFTNGRLVGTYPYAFVKASEIAPYRSLASQYVLADHMYPTEFGSSFPAHQALIAGSEFVSPRYALANDPTAAPWGCDAPKTSKVTLEKNGYPTKKTIFPCFDQYPTMADLLDHAGLSWKYYVAPESGDVSGREWNAFDAIKRVRNGTDWKSHIVSPAPQVLKDAAAGNLAAVSWVVPDLDWSDDPASASDKGPSWVAAVVNAIGKGPDWNSTAVIIVWSEWGGWYEGIENPILVDPLQYSGLGIRVPCIVVSPYAKRNYVSHTVYQFGSILKFAEETFGLPSLSSAGYGYVFTDTIANDFSDAFDFNAGPRMFRPIPAKYPPSTF